MSASLQSITVFLKNNWIVALIICIGTVLRIWHLDAYAILNDQAALPLMTAHEKLQQANALWQTHVVLDSTPMRSLATSWLSTAVVTVAGTNTLAVALLFAVFSVVSLIAVYEWMCIYVHKPAALVSAGLAAVSPLLIVHARIPFYAAALPLFLLMYLFSMCLLWHHYRFSVLWSVVSYGILLHFDMQLWPLALALVFVLSRRYKKLHTQTVIQLILGVCLLSFPYLASVFSNPLNLPVLSLPMPWWFVSTTEAITPLAYIFSLNPWWAHLLYLAVAVSGWILLYDRRNSKALTPAIYILETVLGALLLSIVIASDVSAVLLSALSVLMIMHLAVSLTFLSKQHAQTLLIAMLIIGIINIKSALAFSTWVIATSPVHQGTTVLELRNMTAFMASQSQGNYTVYPLEKGNTDTEYTAAISWVALEAGQPMPTTGQPFYIAKQPSSISSDTALRYRDFKGHRVYWLKQ